jgi:glycosyltransferase involved in cell wall biosynthesis
VIVSFTFPSGREHTAGVVVLYELANALARRGHEVQFLHGPAAEFRVSSLDELPPFRFEGAVRHHLFDDWDDPALPEADVVFTRGTAPRFGLHASVVQGYRMLDAGWELEGYRYPAPKVCVARWLVDVGLSLGVDAEQLWHVPLGLDHELFARHAGDDDRPYDVAMLYHPHEQKGGDVGLRALDEVRRRRPDVRAVVFGRARPPAPLPAGTDFLFAPDQRTLVDRVYNATRVFLQASRHEGFGYTAVEAMACGAALVTTDCGGSRDYAVDGVTALVAPVEDHERLARRIVHLGADDRARGRLAAAGERDVRRFDWDRSAELLERHLLDYLAEPERFRRPARPLEPAEGVA